MGGAGEAKGIVAWREERCWARAGPERGVRTVPKGRKQFAMRCGAWERSLDFRLNLEPSHAVVLRNHRKDQSPGEELWRMLPVCQEAFGCESQKSQPEVALLSRVRCCPNKGCMCAYTSPPPGVTAARTVPSTCEVLLALYQQGEPSPSGLACPASPGCINCQF